MRASYAFVLQKNNAKVSTYSVLTPTFIIEPKYSKEVKEKAIYLSEKGWNSFSIAKELEIPESTVNGWLLKFKINHNINRKMVKQVFSADFKRKVIETRWKNKLSFKEVAEHFNLDNPSLIAAW